MQAGALQLVADDVASPPVRRVSGMRVLLCRAMIDASWRLTHSELQARATPAQLASAPQASHLCPSPVCVPLISNLAHAVHAKSSLDLLQFTHRGMPSEALALATSDNLVGRSV